MATPMGSGRGNVSMLASLMAGVFGIIFLSSPAWGDSPVIGAPLKQMSTNGTQTLTASGGCGGPYTWSISSGGGSLSSSTGNSVVYTAPSSQTGGCGNNPTITNIATGR